MQDYLWKYSGKNTSYKSYFQNMFKPTIVQTVIDNAPPYSGRIDQWKNMVHTISNKREKKFCYSGDL